jgi:uncharacterized membrane protein
MLATHDQAHPRTRGLFRVHSISLLAVGWRNRVAQRLGTRAWQGIYSNRFAAWVLPARQRLSSHPGIRRGVVRIAGMVRYVAVLLMLPVFTLVLASVLPGRIKARVQHPLLLATMLWSLAHLLTNGSVTDVLLFGTFLVWSVAVRISLDRRPGRPALGFSARLANDAIALSAGIALYVAIPSRIARLVDWGPDTGSVME